MRSSTNLAWPTEPFGAGQRPFGRDRPLLAALGTGWDGHMLHPMWGCAVYLAIPSTCTLQLDGHLLNFGFEVVTPEPADQPAALAVGMDERLVACRRRARVLAGHDLGADLDGLQRLAIGRRLPGVDGVRRQWADRAAKGRGMARMIDTAHDIDLPAAPPTDGTGRADLVALCGYADLTMLTVADPRIGAVAQRSWAGTACGQLTPDRHQATV